MGTAAAQVGIIHGFGRRNLARCFTRHRLCGDRAGSRRCRDVLGTAVELSNLADNYRRRAEKGSQIDAAKAPARASANAEGEAWFERRLSMTHVYFHCSNRTEVLVDRCGALVDDLAEARDHAACVVRSLTTARSLGRLARLDLAGQRRSR